MSRALVALDALRQFTDGTPEDLAALLVEVVGTHPVAGPWQTSATDVTPSWSRKVAMHGSREASFAAIVEKDDHGWLATVRPHANYASSKNSCHPTPEEARDACDGHLRAAGWLLL